jgi:sugar lactone lactonase YvrE
VAVLEFRTLTDVRCELGESPVWDARRRALWFCDIVGHALHRVEIASGEHRQWQFPTEVASIGLAESGRVVVSLRDVVGLFDPDSEAFTEVAVIERDRRDTRLNDGKVGPDGAFWVGTMDDSGRPMRSAIGSLYRVTAAGGVETKIEGLITSNGLAFTRDGCTMFHSDSAAKWIDRWEMNPVTGEISGRKRIAELDEESGRPDGGATDIEGCYWSAGISAARLNRFTRDGRLLASYPVPVAAPTMPCFGGDDMRALFVTSIRAGRAPEKLRQYPLTGITIVGQSPVAGAPVSLFRDQ